MIKTLLRKELSQIKKMYLTNKRKGRQGGKGMFIFLIICYFLVMLSFGALDSLFAFELIPAGYGWLYYFFILIMGLLMGIIGSVFTTAEMLFKAKDNEFLMAMPIPPARILLVRMIGVYIMGLIYELLIMLPGVILYWIIAGITVLNLLFGLLGIVLLGFVILTFSCLFGWLVAVITAKLKNKNILTVFISVIFIGLFIFIRFKANTFFRDLVTNAVAIGDSIMKMPYPVYAPGLGMTGDVPAMLVFAGIAGVLFGLTYWIISRSFMSVVNIRPSEKKAVFSESQIQTSGLGKALFRKELRRFLSSPNYMLNCGLGILFLVAASVAALITAGQIRSIAESAETLFPGGAKLIPVMVTFVVCILSGLIDIAAPSISLEGPGIWILQSMPVTAAQVLRAKFLLAALLSAVPTVICVTVVMIVTGASAPEIILGVICAAAFVLFMTLFGLRGDLARPYLDWANEVQPIKQNMNVLFPMLLGMLGPIVPAGLYFLLAPVIPPVLYLAVWAVIFILISLLILNWFRRNGEEKFARLGQ